MENYEVRITEELKAWQAQMVRRPSFLNNLSKKFRPRSIPGYLKRFIKPLQ
jgi:hypothetical protein